MRSPWPIPNGNGATEPSHIYDLNGVKVFGENAEKKSHVAKQGYIFWDKRSGARTVVLPDSGSKGEVQLTKVGDVNKSMLLVKTPAEVKVKGRVQYPMEDATTIEIQFKPIRNVDQDEQRRLQYKLEADKYVIKCCSSGTRVLNWFE